MVKINGVSAVIRFDDIDAFCFGLMQANTEAPNHSPENTGTIEALVTSELEDFLDLHEDWDEGLVEDED